MSTIRRMTLEEARRMRDAGETHSRPDAPPGPDLGPEFWANAKLVKPAEPRSVHLKLDPEVFDYFKAGGKGHLTRMQDVLKAYVRAHTRS